MTHLARIFLQLCFLVGTVLTLAVFLLVCRPQLWNEITEMAWRIGL